MSLSAYRKAKNIRLTFQSAIPNPLPVNTVTATGAARSIDVPVIYDYAWGDGDLMADPKAAPPDAFVTLTWLDEKAGRNGLSVVQIDVWNRVGPKGGSTGDAFGIVVDDIADEIESRFAGARPDGTLRAWIPILDYSIPASPIDAEACLFVQDPGTPSGWGCPVERRRIVSDDGFQRIALTFAMRLDTDAIPGGLAYMD